MEVQISDIDEISANTIESDHTPELPHFNTEPMVSKETVKLHSLALRSYLESTNRGKEYVSVQPMIESLLEKYPGQSRVPADTVGHNFDLASNWLGESRLGIRLAAFFSRPHPDLERFFRQSHVGLFDYSRMLKRYLAILTDVFSVTVEKSDSQLALVFHPHPDIYVSRHQIETMVASIYGAVLEIHGITPDSIQFGIAPEGDVADYIGIFGCLPEFNASSTRLVFPSPVDVRYQYAESSQEEASSPISEQAFRTLRTLELSNCQTSISASKRWSERTRFLIELLLSIGEPNEALIADVLAVTPGTLQRRLGDEGTVYEELLDQVRETKAKEYLRSENLSLDDVAFLLGFKETATFYQAFKQWTRMTPSEYRAFRGGYLV